ncbi:helix-turn-helix transcriptional regulator [Streptomyces sp. NPDC046978]|uniref:helix-turn-helix domain-containing protein n=1 Tax=Streptomyces sp. NPDC046978 TaxID=3154704 RepID=UPI0033D2F3CE
MGPTACTVAENLRRLRDARGLSLRTLSQRVEEAGHALSADAINKIENGRLLATGDVGPKHVRRADADDIVALALALNVSPLTLLLPPTAGNDRVTLTNSVTVTGRAAWSWAEGRQTASQTAADDTAAQHERQEAYEALALPPERRRLESLPAVRSARRLYEALAELISIRPTAGQSTQAAAQGRAARRRHEQLGHEIDDLMDQLPPPQ